MRCQSYVGDSINSVNEIEQLYTNGSYKSCLMAISALKTENENVTENDQVFEIHLFKIYCLIHLGDLELAIDIISETIEIPDLENHYLVIIIKARMFAYYRKGLLNEALDYCDQINTLIQQLSETDQTKIQVTKIQLMELVGSIYMSLGELEKASKYFSDALTLAQEINNLQEIAYVLHSIGNVYFKKGQLQTALVYYNDALIINNKPTNQYHRSIYLDNIATVSVEQGKYEEAMKHYEQSLSIFKEIDHQQGVAHTLSSLGILYGKEGNFQESLKLLEQGLIIRKKIGNPNHIIDSLFNIIITVLKISPKSELIEDYLLQLENINFEQDNKKNKLYFQLAKALILKSKPRLRDKMQGGLLLQNIIEEEIIQHNLTILAMKHYCELLILELSSQENETVLKEVTNLIDSLHAIAEKYYSNSLKVEVLILKAKFSLIINISIEETETHLVKALKIAESNEMDRLAFDVSLEIDNLKDLMTKWKKLALNELSIREKIKEIHIFEYLNEIQKIIRA